MLRIALKGIRANPLRLAATAVAVVLGVAFMAGTLVLKDGIARTFDRVFAQAGDGIDVVIREQAAFFGPFFDAQRPDLPESTVASVAAVPGVAAAAGVVEDSAQFVDRDGETIGSAFGGRPLALNWIEDERLNPWRLSEGRAPAGPGEVVIDRATARAHDFGVGDTVELIVVGAPQPFQVVGVARFGDLDSAGGATTALFETAAAQAMFAKEGKVDSVEVAAVEGISQDELAGRIRPVVSPSAEVITGEDFLAEQQSAVRDALDSIGTVLLVLALVALFVGSFIIANTFSIIVTQRARELALLRAVGARRSQVLGAVLAEAAVVGAVGGLGGLAVGAGLATLLQGFLNEAAFGASREAPVVTGGTAVTALFTGLVVTVVAALWPAVRASRVPPVAAMRDVAFDRSGSSRRRTLTGSVVSLGGAGLMVAGLFGDSDFGLQMVGAGVFFVFIGVTVLGPVLAGPAARLLGAPIRSARGFIGVLARENAVRNPSRTASTASALMIGVALVTLLFLFIASLRSQITTTIESTFRGDVVVDTGTFGFGGVSPALTAEVAALPEVAAATGLRIGPAQVAGRGGVVMGVDPVALAQIVDLGVVAGAPSDLVAGRVAISEDVATESGITVGSMVTGTFTATGSQPLQVAMIYRERELVGDFLVDLATYDANFPLRVDLQVWVVAAPGASVTQTRDAVARVAASYPNTRVQDRDEFTASQSAPLDPILVLFTALLGFAIVIALFGITNTLALSVLERTRELGLLRAVGMTRQQVRAAVRWESVIISVFGTLLGLSVGLFFAFVLLRALEDEGFEAFTLPLGSLAGVVVVAVVAGIVTGLWPARRAARVDLLAALASE